jgi:hypothetical protein
MLGPRRRIRNSYEATMPKLRRAAYAPEKVGVLVLAARTRSPVAVTTSAEMRWSEVRPTASEPAETAAEGEAREAGLGDEA